MPKINSCAKEDNTMSTPPGELRVLHKRRIMYKSKRTRVKKIGRLNSTLTSIQRRFARGCAILSYLNPSLIFLDIKRLVFRKFFFFKRKNNSYIAQIRCGS
jgi:hypothetical protein